MAKRVLILILLVVFQLNSYSKKEINFDYRNPLEYEIASIKVEGLVNIDKNILLNMTNLKVGQKIMIPGDDISGIIKKMWGLGLFSDVKFEAEKIEGVKIYLVLHVKEKPRLNEIKFEGIDEDDAEDILKNMKITYGSQISKDVLNTIEYRTKQFLDEEGYINAEIDIIQKPAKDDDTKVDLTVKVDQKGEVEIYDILVEGNTVFDDDDIRDFMEENKRIFKFTRLNFGNMFSSSNLDYDKLRDDINLIKEGYKEEGYRNVQVELDTVYFEDVDEDDTFAYLRLKIDEGQQYFVRTVQWVGNTKYDSDALTRELKVEPGDVYNQKLINDRLFVDEDAVSNLYLNNGYLFFNVTPVEAEIVGDSIDLQLRVREGKPANIDKIIIKGNTKTYENVIRRELYTYPGELFSKEDIIRSIRQLAQLRYFDQEKLSTGVKPIPKPETGKVDVEYNLSEVSNDQLELSAGYGGGSFVGSIALKFGNFSATNFFDPDTWPKFSGDGQSLAFRIQVYGEQSQTYSISFSEPWLGGVNPNSFTFSLAYTRYTDLRSVNPYNSYNYGGYGRGYGSYGYGYGSGYGSYGYDLSNVDVSALPRMETFTASVGIGKRLKVPDDYFQIYHSLNYKRYMLKDWSSFLFKNGNSNSITYRVSFGRNSINNPIFPTNGSKVNITLAATPPFSMFRDDNWWEADDAVKNDFKNEVLNDASVKKDDASVKTAIDNKVAEYEASHKYDWLEYYKVNFEFDWYTRVVDKLVLRTSTRFGLLGSYDSQVISPFEGFYVGGDGFSSYSYYGRENVGVRGYDSGDLVPLSASQASSYVKHTVELRYPVTMQPSATIYVLGFFEGANSWIDHEKIDVLDIKRTAGVGVRIFMPIFGMLGFDLGYGFDSFERGTSNPGWLPQFIIGQSF